MPQCTTHLTMAAFEVLAAVGPLLNSAFPDTAWVQQGLSVEVHLGGKIHVVDTSLHKPWNQQVVSAGGVALLRAGLWNPRGLCCPETRVILLQSQFTSSRLDRLGAPWLWLHDRTSRRKQAEAANRTSNVFLR